MVIIELGIYTELIFIHRIIGRSIFRLIRLRLISSCGIQRIIGNKIILSYRQTNIFIDELRLDILNIHTISMIRFLPLSISRHVMSIGLVSVSRYDYLKIADRLATVKLQSPRIETTHAV